MTEKPSHAGLPGIRVYPETPDGFNVDAADSEELAFYGLPQRPDKRRNPRHFELWRELCPPNIKTKQPQVEKIQDLHYRMPPRPQDLLGSPEWAGGVIRPDAGHSFAVVGCSFTVPSVASSGSPYCAIGIWTGLDGGFNSAPDTPIVQIGVSATVVNGEASYYAFYEWYPGPAYRITNMDVAAGDKIGISLGVGPGSDTNLHPNEAAALFSSSAHPRVPVIFTAPPGVTFAGNSAEWILERPLISSPVGFRLADLPLFDDLTIRGAASGPLSEPLGYYDYGDTQDADIISMVDTSTNPPTLTVTTTLVSQDIITIHHH